MSYSTPLGRRGFTLLELLSVMAIISVLLAVVHPSVESLSGSSQFSSSVWQFSDTFDQARACAVSRHTYVYVGVGEFQASAPDSVGKAGSGRVAMFVVASRNGSRVAASSDFATQTLPVSKLIKLNNLHFTTVDTNSDGLVRPSNDSVQKIDDWNGTTGLTFPLGSTAQYSFPVLIEFSPQGMARIYGADILPGFVEMGLSPSKGASVVSSSQVAVVQLSGLTGKLTLYRP
jgi:prepilin-type N-terminal cleavage/methylation domain-containing protein